ncbi:MAG: hypothetical protein JNL98_34100 [Bryobacterales bacterium]|nr:hypothetical protein [Bryobacterales bacterium]
MKILLDECLPVDFRHSFPDHEVHSAQWAGFRGMKNGRLLLAAEESGYDVLVTIDQGIRHQQNSAGRQISILILCAATSKIEDLLPLVAVVRIELAELQKGQVRFVR